MNQLLALLPSRTSLWWAFSSAGAFCVALMGHFQMFPWITPQMQQAIEFVAFAYTFFSGKMAASPLKS